VQTITCTEFGTFLGRRSERLLLRCKKQETEIPLFRIGEIVVPARGVSLSGELIEAACERGIPITFVTSTGRPFALLSSPMLTATVKTRRRQLAAYAEPLGAQLCRLVVGGKLRNQAGLLAYGAKYLGVKDPASRLEVKTCVSAIRDGRRRALAVRGDCPDEVRDELMGIEGAAGRTYWRGIGTLLGDSIEFEGRKRRGAVDPLNAVLNYGYGILYAKVWACLLNAGLEPFGGFLHVDRPGKPSLVLDLIEEFRAPVVDRAVLAYVNQGRKVRFEGRFMDEATRRAVADAVLDRLASRVVHRGRKVTLQSVVQAQARALAVFLRGEGPYRPFTMYW
jgi:CRISPR-associated protein Cas1